MIFMDFLQSCAVVTLLLFNLTVLRKAGYQLEIADHAGRIVQILAVAFRAFDKTVLADISAMTAYGIGNIEREVVAAGFYKQVIRFTVPESDGNWSLYLYCGLMQQTSGNTITYIKCKLEEGCIPTTWSPAPEDTTSQIEQLLGSIDGLDATLETRVMSLIESMG